MKLNNRVYYHIKRANTPSEDWKVSNTFNWNSRKNNFVKEIFDVDLKMQFRGDKMSYRNANDRLLGLSSREKDNHLFDFYNFGSFALNKTSMMLREVIFENYRIENCQHLPSRHSSLWVCNQNSIDYWCKALQINSYDIYKVRLTGISHKASEKNLYSDVINVNQHLEMAKKYWSENQPDLLDTEIIFDGIIEVVEKIK